MKIKVCKWGNSLGVRLPKHLAEELGLTVGSPIELGRDGTKLVAETALKRSIPHYRLEDLVAEMKRLGPQNEPETLDWGPDVGSEIVDDAYSRGDIKLDDILKAKARRKVAARGRKQHHAPRGRRHRMV